MVYTLGESLLDIVFSTPENVVAKPGGSMLNTAVSLGRCGIKTSMISETGDDMTAQLILNFLEKNGVQTGLIKKYYHQKTSVALAFLDENKKPVYSIHKSYPENRIVLSPNEFTEKDIFCFGSLYSLDRKIRNEISALMALSKSQGCILVYDPNIRSHQFENKSTEVAFFENIAFANIVKASDEDLINIFGKQSIDEYFKKILAINPDAIVIVTMGENGAMAVKGNFTVKVPAKKIDVVSTVGAGDAFNAGIVFYLEKNQIARADLNKLEGQQLNAMLESGILFSTAVCQSIENYVPQKFAG